MLFNRFSIVPELSSAARIPLPGATSFLATVSKSSVFMIFFVFVELNFSLLPRKIFGEMQTKTGLRITRQLSNALTSLLGALLEPRRSNDPALNLLGRASAK